MATISSAGIGSGLDVSGIIRQIMSIERQPLTRLETEKSELNTELSNIGKLQSLFSTFRDANRDLTSVSLWNQTAATSADESVVTVSSSNGAAQGSYSVQVQDLATGQTVTSSAFSSSSTTLNEGSLTIELGTWTGDPVSGFTPKSGSSAVVVSIGAGATSLADIRDAINDADAGVTASIVNDASGARLSIRSTETGAENAFRITATETTDDGVASTGLSALAFDRAGGASQMSLNQASQNASATINGIAVTSASNTLTDVVDGLTIRLLKESTSAVEVTVADDKAAVKEKIEAFVKAFNDLATYIKDQTKYDAATKKAGALQGDRMVIGLQWQLRAVINQETTASSVFTRLSDIGLVMKADGTLENKSSKLEDGLENLAELRKLFSTDGATTAGTGFMQRFKELADAALGTEGSFETRTDSLKTRLDRNGDRQDAISQRLEQTEKRLRQQYEALDQSMGKLSTLSSYVSQQMSMLSK